MRGWGGFRRGGGGLSRGRAAGSRRERRQSPALALALVAVAVQGIGISRRGSGARQAADGSKRLVQAAAIPQCSLTTVKVAAVLFLVAEAMVVAAMLEADGDERLMSQTTWTRL